MGLLVVLIGVVLRPPKPDFFQFSKKSGTLCAAICFDAPGSGALASWLKSNVGPTRGTASRMARVFIARWNLKKGIGRMLVRRTGSTSEAAAADEMAGRLKVQYLHGSCGSISICDGHKRGIHCAICGRII